MTAETMTPGTTDCVPDANCLIPRTTGHLQAVGGEGHASHIRLVAAQQKQCCATNRVPDPHRLVPGTAGQPRTIGRKGNDCHNKPMTAEAEEVETAARIPNPGGVGLGPTTHAPT